MQVGSTLAPGFGCDQKVSVTPRRSGSGCELWKFIFLGDAHHLVVSIRKMLLSEISLDLGCFLGIPRVPAQGIRPRKRGSEERKLCSGVTQTWVPIPAHYSLAL